MADFTVAPRADSVHTVPVVLAAARVSEDTPVVYCPTLSLCAGVVYGRGHVVEGVVGGLPAKDNHIAGALVAGPSVSWRTGDWVKETENETSKHD